MPVKWKNVYKTPVNPNETETENQLISINRCATVVKGGRRFSFSALVAVGNKGGTVGIGFGKANEVPPAVEKAEINARKDLYRISIKGDTIPHRITGRFRASKVVMIPAAPGTGIIAGTAVKSVLSLAGIKDILTKAYGSTNPVNLVKATMDGLLRLKSLEEVEKLRGVKLG